MGRGGMYRVVCEFEPYFNVQPLRASLGMLLAEKAEKAGNGGGGGDGGGGGGGAAPKVDANEAALAQFRGGWNAGWVKKNTPMLPSVHSTGFRKGKGVGSGDRGGGGGYTDFRSAKPPPPGVRAKLAAAAEQRRLQQEEVDDAGASRSYGSASSGCGAFGVKSSGCGAFGANSSTAGAGRPAFGSRLRSSGSGAAAYGGSVDTFLHSTSTSCHPAALLLLRTTAKPEWDGSLLPLPSNDPYEPLFTAIEVGLVRPLPPPGHPLLDPEKYVASVSPPPQYICVCVIYPGVYMYKYRPRG